jgi:hypothetical protein
MSNKFRSVEHQAIAIMSESSGKFVGNRGPSFRTSSTSNPDWHDKSGIDVGAARNTAHQDAARKADAESERAKEKQIKDRTEKAKERQQGTMNMAKEEVMAEGKKTFVPFKADEGMVKRYMQRSEEDLGGMIDRWSNDHAKNPETDLDTSEKLLAVHAAATRLGHNPPALPQHKNLGTHKLVMGEEISKGTAARTDIENVARPTGAGPASEKSKLGKQGEIKKMQESASKIDFGLSKNLIDATRSILEKNDNRVNLNPETKIEGPDDDEMSEKMHKTKRHTVPKTDRERELAAKYPPEDKITQGDIVAARMKKSMKKEETDLEEMKRTNPFLYAGGAKERNRHARKARRTKNEEVDFTAEAADLEEISKSTLGSYVRKAGAERGHLGMDVATFTDKKNKKEALRKMKNRLTGINRAVDRLTKEEVDFTADELEHLDSIIDSFADGNKVNEAKDEREYGYEGEMVSSQLRSIIQNAEALLGMIQPDTDFPEWVQSKITLAQDYMLSAKDYMSTEMSEETKLDEARGRPKKTGEAPEGDDTHKHPIQQLSKIGYAIQGSEPAFEHKDGSKTKITKQLARHITTAYNAMRTSQEKDDFATKLHANRDSMMAAVKKHV